MRRLIDPHDERNDADRHPSDFDTEAFMEPVSFGRPRRQPPRPPDGARFPSDLPV